ncbi:hypothetical protein PO909_012262 [Leuciscus waleckii]
MNRFGKALKDEKFRELLLEYAAEISDPENRTRYEEEITQMEEDRGFNVQFIHPEANHVLKTRSARGKCFINICSNPRIDEPSCKAARDRGGEPGQNWRLPFSLTPGRADRDAAGNSCEVYDVVFHPDALHMASKNARFMKLIHSTAIGGIEDSFHIEINREQIKQLRMRYKGVAHPAVIRRPIPGHDQKNQSSGEDMLSFPYPDENRTGPEPEPEASQRPPNPDDTRSKQPITPHYTVKYRSVVDLQDYRCSRDSGPGTRPREIVVIIDVPLLGSALDAEVCVTERRLVLEAPEPAYRLDLPLAYPVDEEKGDAKFNKTKKQLTITLPVRPVKTPELQMSCDEAKSNVNEEADQNPQEEGLDPDHTDLDLDHTGGGLDPDHTDLDPDHTEGGLDLDHTESERSQLTCDTPFEPQFTDLTTERQTHEINPTENRTEPDRSVEDETNINRAVDSSSDTGFVRESHRLHSSDEEAENTSLQADNTTLIHQQTSSSVTEQEDPNSSREAEDPETKCSSGDRGSAGNAGIRSEDPVLRETSHMTSAALCFQNTLRFDLD